MEFSAKQIADFLQGVVEGDENVKVSDLSKIEEGREGTLTFLSNPKYTHYIYTTNASIVLVDKDFEAEAPISATLIRVESSYQSLSKLLQLVESTKPAKQGIDNNVSIAEDAVYGDSCYIGPFAVLGKGVRLGNNVKIYPHVHLDDYTEVDDDTTIYSNVTVYSGCKIGKRCIVHAGAVIGADGFGFAPDEEGHYHKIPQIGNVVLKDDVEIGANTTIDRATLGSTIIGKGVKIDNLIQIAHNVEIGEDTAMAAQSGVAGSTKIGKRCILAGQVGVAGHLHIADGSVFGAQTGIPSSIKEPGKIWQGYPAMPVGNFRRLSVIQKQLPDLQRLIYDMDKRLKKIEDK